MIVIAVMGRGSRCCNLSWFINDGVGIGCAVFTYLLIAYAEFVVVFVMLLPEVISATVFGILHAITFTFLASLAVVAHSRAMCSDPVSNFIGHRIKFVLVMLGFHQGNRFVNSLLWLIDNNCTRKWSSRLDFFIA